MAGVQDARVAATRYHHECPLWVDAPETQERRSSALQSAGRFQLDDATLLI